jgi:hypothetical protein
MYQYADAYCFVYIMGAITCTVKVRCGVSIYIVTLFWVTGYSEKEECINGVYRKRRMYKWCLRKM